MRHGIHTAYGRFNELAEPAMVARSVGSRPLGRPWAMCLHGHNAAPSIFLPTAGSFGDDVGALTDTGMWCVAPDAAGGDAWGGPYAMTALDTCYTYAQTLGLAPTCAIFAWSMGGLTGLNWARRNTAKVRAMLLLAPATDLDYFYANAAYTYEIDWALSAARTTAATQVQLDATADPLVLAASTGYPTGAGAVTIVDAAVGTTYKRANFTSRTGTTLNGTTLVGGGFYDVFVGQSVALLGDYNTLSTGYNPIDDAASFGWCPLTIIHGDADTTVPLSQSQAFVAAVNDPDVTVEVAVGAGHNPGGAFSSSRTVALLAA